MSTARPTWSGNRVLFSGFTSHPSLGPALLPRALVPGGCEGHSGDMRGRGAPRRAAVTEAEKTVAEAQPGAVCFQVARVEAPLKLWEKQEPRTRRSQGAWRDKACSRHRLVSQPRSPWKCRRRDRGARITAADGHRFELDGQV